MNNLLTYSAIVVKAVGEMFCVYGLLGWLYGILVQFTYPYLLPETLSHLTPYLRVDTFAIISFIISVVGFLMWRLAKQLTCLQCKDKTNKV